MKVSIIGAGFSGLSLAYYLVKKDFQVEIIESSNTPGGMIQTLDTELGLVETAATSILLTSEIEEITKEIKLKYLLPKKKSRKKYISVNNNPTRIPLKIIDFFFLFKGLFKIFFKKKKSTPIEGETLAEWADRIFNQSIRKRLISPAMLGIYAESSENLSASLVLKKVFSTQKRKKSKGPVNFMGGMASFIKALEIYLKQQGVTFKYDSKINSLNQLETPIAVATSFKQAKDLGLDLPEMPLKNMTSVTLFYDGSPPLEGFGTLFPKEEKLNAQGVLFNTSMFEGRTKSGFSETWILSEKTNQKDEDLLKLILIDRSKVFSSKEDPKKYVISHWPNAFPIYGTLLEGLLKVEIKTPKAVYLTGNYLGNLGLSGIIEQNKILSLKMAAELL